MLEMLYLMLVNDNFNAEDNITNMFTFMTLLI